jgi:nucleoside-diphosphate-sugar epimerase
LANFLVTGHLGYIGTHVVDLLTRSGHRVRGIDLDLYEGCDFDSLPRPDETRIKDILDVTPEDFAGCDAVIHLAALSNDPLGELDRAWTYKVNYEGTVRVAEAAREAGVPRFVFASSCSLYGAAGDAAMTEENEGSPVTVYGETKILAEEALLSMAGDTFSPVIMRNATAYGSSPRLRLDVVINNLMAWAFATREIRVISDGTPWRPLVHCRDIARGAIMAAQAPRELVHGEVFNFGRGTENYQVRDLVDIVAKTVPGCEVVYTGEGGPDSRDYRVNFDKFSRRFPSFEFLHDVRSGAAELHREYTRYPMTKEVLEGPRFVRLRTVKGRLERLVRAG